MTNGLFNQVIGVGMIPKVLLIALLSILWHGIFYDKQLNERASVYYSAPWEQQSLYAGGRLYEVRYGLRTVSYDPDQPNESLKLIPRALIKQQRASGDLRSLLRAGVRSLRLCTGSFHGSKESIYFALLYQWEINGKHCTRVSITRKSGEVVFVSYTRTDIPHVTFGVIVGDGGSSGGRVSAARLDGN